MSTLLMVKSGKFGWVMSDSQATNCNLKVGADKKFLADDHTAIGVVGDMWVMSVAEAHFSALLKNSEPYSLQTHIHAVIEATEHKPPKEEGEVYQWNIGLICARGVWCLDPDGSVVRFPDEHLLAMGSGRDFALGAWHALRDTDMPCHERLSRSMSAAMRYDIYTGGPVHFRRLRFDGTSQRDSGGRPGGG